MQQSIDILQNGDGIKTIIQNGDGVNMFIHATKHRYFAEWRWY